MRRCNLEGGPHITKRLGVLRDTHVTSRRVRADGLVSDRIFSLYWADGRETEARAERVYHRGPHIVFESGGQVVLSVSAHAVCAVHEK